MPSAYDDLRALPGVGDYTAAAIATFGFGRRHAVLDTNVRRVLARLVSGVELPPVAATAGEKRLAEGLLPEDEADAATWSIALMELGALVCTAARPRCDACPVADAVRVAGGGLPGVRRPAAQGADLGGHGPPVPRPPARRRSATPRAPCPRRRLDQAWDDEPQRDRCLASLLTDGLLVQVPEGYALPG